MMASRFVLACCLVDVALSFSVVSPNRDLFTFRTQSSSTCASISTNSPRLDRNSQRFLSNLVSDSEDGDGEDKIKANEAIIDGEIVKFESEEQKKELVGNLVADDEWMGLSMELSEVIRVAVIEDLKKNAREFLDKDEYKLGDFSKEIDARVKDSVAAMRGKEEYELGDLVLAMDEMSKNYTEQLTGKPYQPGDLSIELDRRIKQSVANWCGKEEYEAGDLTREVSRRVMLRVEEFTGKDEYEFGDITRAIEDRRREWVKNFLGEEAANNYKFGDITKRVINNWTGKEEYQFGDITRKLVSGIFGKRKRGGDQ